MPEINFVAVLAAAAAAFVVGAIWNSPLLFGNIWLRLRGIDPASCAGAAPPVRQMIAEFVRCLVIAAVLAALIALVSPDDLLGSIGLAILLWIGFPAAYLTGAIIWEDLDWRIYAIHVGDALVKMILVAAIIHWFGR
jgi:hypothetical protein